MTVFAGPASTRLGRFFGPTAEAHPGLSGFRLLGQAREAFIVRLALADLAERREVDVRLGRVPEELAGTPVATTFAPVPGFVRRSASVDVAALHPWPWLVRPGTASIRSFSAWRRDHRR